MENQIEKLRRMTGETEMEDKGMRIKYMRFNGQLGSSDSGIFQIPEGIGIDGKKMYKALGETMKGIILRVTTKLKTNLTSKRNLETDEFGSYETEISIYEDQDFKNPIDSGTKAELQQKYTELSIVNIVYVYVNNSLYKLTINGGSLNNLWTYLSTFTSGEKKESCMMYHTEFGREEAENKVGLKYYQITFKRDTFNDLWMNMMTELQTINNRLIAAPEEKHSNEITIDPEEDEIKSIGAPKTPPTDEELAVSKNTDEDDEDLNIPF